MLMLALVVIETVLKIKAIFVSFVFEFMGTRFEIQRKRQL